MSEPIFWTNVAVSVQTAVTATAIASAITQATEGQVTFTGDAPEGLQDGAIVLFTDVNGMIEVSNRAFRVKTYNAGGKTFLLEAEDTSEYGAFTSGKFAVVTLGASFRSIQNVNASGGDFEKADLTTIHDLLRKRRSTIANPVTFSFTNLFDLDDLGFKQCVKAHRSKTTRVVMFSFGTGPKILVVGAPAATGVPTGQAQGVVQTPVEIECQGMPTPIPA